MKINKIIIENELNGLVVNELLIPEDKKGIVITGKNQTGKTTFLYQIQGVFGFQVNYLKKALDIEDVKYNNAKLEVNHGHSKYIFKRKFADDFYKKDKSRTSSRPGYTTEMSVIINDANEYKTTFLEEYYSTNGLEMPRSLSISSMNQLELTNRGDYRPNIQITDYCRLFIHSQNPEIILGSHIFSNSITLLVTFISMVTNELDYDIDEFINLYIEREQNSLLSKIKSINDHSTMKMSESDKRAVLILSAKKDVKNKGKEKISKKIMQLKSEILKNDKILYELKIALDETNKRIESLKINKVLKDYVKTIMRDEIFEKTFADFNEVSEKIKSIEKKNRVLKKEYKDLKENLWENYDSTIDNLYKGNIIFDEKLEEIVFDSYKKQSIDKLVSDSKKKFSVTERIKAIEKKFFSLFVDDIISNEISSLSLEIEKNKEKMNSKGNDFYNDLESFNSLKFANFKIFDRDFDSAAFRPQGAMLDIYQILKMYIYVKALEKQGKKIPFVIIDTPFRNENIGFYKFVPKLIIQKIIDSEAVENVLIATASDEVEENIFENVVGFVSEKDESNFNIRKIQ